MGNADLRQLQKLDQASHIHPFTNHNDLAALGTSIIERAEGCWVFDSEGHRLLDGLAGLWCVNVGYGRHEIIEAVHRQMLRLPYYCSFFNTTNEPAIRLADRLSRLAPGRLRRTMFCGSGSEANETAIKVIRAWNRLRKRPQKTKLLSRKFSYHGVTLGAASLTGLPSVTDPFDLPLPGFVQVPGPHPYAANTDLDSRAYGQWCVEETARIIEREGPHTIAALFVEPVQGAGGVICPPTGYLKSLRQICRDHDILFVADEVITGFGRLGSWFGSELWDLDPDLMTLAKGITSGYLPLGATMLSEQMGDELLKAGYFAHGFTYSSHPTCAAAALANLDLLEKERLVDRVRDESGPYFQSRLREFSTHPSVAEVRGMGLIGALELVPKAGKGAPKPDSALGAKAARIAREEGVIVRGIRDLIAMSPPFTISREEQGTLFAAVRRTLDRFHAES
ncbi:MAG: aminotransferase class III-fold pyridoxal phosphate-dependent enzyme [Verrucomicrobia bacterium]|nr:aminotransferase class III-fold pyridoxal phosphate-dependent enzyme [Verrucomicrobiota bacterium]